MPKVFALCEVQVKCLLGQNKIYVCFRAPIRITVDFLMLSLRPEIMLKLSIMYINFSKDFLEPSVIKVASSANIVFFTSNIIHFDSIMSGSFMNMIRDNISMAIMKRLRG